MRLSVCHSPAALKRALIPVLLALSLASPAALSHGFAGKRFFPTTLAIDDPFVSDEFSLLFNHIRAPSEEEGGPVTRTTVFAGEYAKRLTPHWGLSLGGEYLHRAPKGERDENGFGNLEVGTKYQFLTSERHEALLSLGLEAELANTGSADVGAESFTVLTPALFFGKGLGDLPDGAAFLKPIALTGIVGGNLPSSSKIVSDEGIGRNPTTISYGLTVQYNLNYLQSFVRDVHMGAPFNRMIPLVEFALDTCVNQDCKGDTTATAYPGLIWFGKSLQLGLSAQIPLNDRTGNSVGVLALFHLFIDDLFPHTLGRPLFGG